jgi:hypothetical protein
MMPLVLISLAAGCSLAAAAGAALVEWLISNRSWRGPGGTVQLSADSSHDIVIRIISNDGRRFHQATLLPEQAGKLSVALAGLLKGAAK